MELKIDQKIVLIFFALGVLVSLSSNSFAAVSPENSLLIALLFPVLIYIAALSALLKIVKQKKLKLLVYNSFMGYFLVWLVIWVLLYNL